MSGAIKGKGNGKRGRITINRDGSILLENVKIEAVKFENCEIHAESGKYPIPFADRMNSFENYLAQFDLGIEEFTVDGFEGTFTVDLDAAYAGSPLFPLYVGGRSDEQYRKDADAAYERYQQARAAIRSKGQPNG